MDKIYIKNVSGRVKNIRPYKDRNVTMSVAEDEIKEITLANCDYHVKISPRGFFNSLGFNLVAESDFVNQWKSGIEKEEKKVPDNKPKVTDESEGVLKRVFDVNKDKFKYFNPLKKSWHDLKEVKKWTIGKVVYDAIGSKFFKVADFDSETTGKCVSISEKDALSITKGVKP